MRISDWSSDVCSSDLALLSSWGEKMPEHAAHAMLAELGVGPEIRKKIIATIPDFEAVLQTDPYRISKEVEGVGFLTADALAQRAGAFQADSDRKSTRLNSSH